ncbi:PREDICTED: apoptosis-associated speck-like protein containing a CARD [Myotis brandtii]|uniref:apoptosis-associated speck-like protein containing a CARD n=1 Tax=Myotis brandtii TaxID=109478 RepID=UPI0007040E7D|nr:PREDICTED: apoptosis-associated speck-like protein containing a CARD [Myotis brandtii]
MAGTRDAILDALEELTADELKKFKMKLLSVPLRDGYGRIPRGALLPMDAVDLADKLVSCYLEPHSSCWGGRLPALGPDPASLETPREGRGRTPYAVSFLTGSGAAPAGMQASPPQVPAIPAPHFVDRHREALIQRVTDVNGVLDALYGSILREEQYQAVRAEATNPDKMRKLFSFAPAWNLACKDRLLQALRVTQPYLVDDLERS